MEDVSTKMKNKNAHEILDEIQEIQTLLKKADDLLGLNEEMKKKTVKNIDELIAEESSIVIERKPVIISVDCIRNTKENVQNGGPEFLGYDFVVDQSNVDEMRHYITMMIKRNKQPLIKSYIRFDEELKEEHIWDKEKIEECINKGIV